MSEIMSQVELAERTDRAVKAAAAAGLDLGLEVLEPVVLHDAFSVVVHLRPSPVVARIPTVLPTHLLNDSPAQLARQRTELDVVDWLAGRGLPVVKPSPLVPREPVIQDGLSMTLWQFVEHDKSVEPDYVANAAVTADLHGSLRDYPGELAFMSQLDLIPHSFAELESRPDLVEAGDLERAQREWATLEPIVSSPAGLGEEFGDLETQVIHGDAPPFNMIPTAEGRLYSDFEDVSLGPVEWDMTMMGPLGEEAYNETARRSGLRQLDGRLLRVMESTRMMQLVACLAMAPRMPMLLEGLKETLAMWRAMPEAGGL